MEIGGVIHLFHSRVGLGEDTRPTNAEELGGQIKEGADNDDVDKRRVNPKFKRIKSDDRKDAKILFSLN